MKQKDFIHQKYDGFPFNMLNFFSLLISEETKISQICIVFVIFQDPSSLSSLNNKKSIIQSETIETILCSKLPSFLIVGSLGAKNKNKITSASNSLKQTPLFSLRSKMVNKNLIFSQMSYFENRRTAYINISSVIAQLLVLKNFLNRDPPMTLFIWKNMEKVFAFISFCGHLDAKSSYMSLRQ